MTHDPSTCRACRIEQVTGRALSRAAHEPLEPLTDEELAQVERDPRFPAAMRALLDRVEAHMDAADAAEPHAVLQTDPATGQRTVIGSFPNREAAEAAIRVLEVRWAAVNEPPMGEFEAILCQVPDADLLAAITAPATEPGTAAS